MTDEAAAASFDFLSIRGITDVGCPRHTIAAGASITAMWAHLPDRSSGRMLSQQNYQSVLPPPPM